MRLFAEVPWTGASNDSGLLRTAIFSVFPGYFFGNFRALLHSDTQSVVGFSVFSKFMTLNDLERLCRVKFCFCAGLTGSDRATFEK